MPEDRMLTGIVWLNEKLKDYVSREVTYRGIRSSVEITATLDAVVGSSQLTPINSLTNEGDFESLTLQNAIEVNRDYEFEIADLEAEGLWPPENGDYIDDSNDNSSTRRYQVKSPPGQNPWDSLQGSYRKRVAVHTKFFSDYSQAWYDTFTGSNGALTAHSPNVGTGSYTQVDGTINIEGGVRVHPQDEDSLATFEPDTSPSRCEARFSFNTTSAALDGKWSSIGVVERYTDANNHIVAEVKLGYTGATQATKELSIIETVSGTHTTVTATVPTALGLTTEYILRVTNQATYVLAELLTATGAVLASVERTSSTGYAEKTKGVRFQSEATVADPTTSYITTLEVLEEEEAS